MRVSLTQNNSTLAKQKPNQNSTHINCIKFDSTLALRVNLTQNQLALAQKFHTSKTNTFNHNISDCDFDLQVRFNHNKLTITEHNPPLFNQSYFLHTSNALFATQSSNHHIKSKLASHNTITINTPLRIEPQKALFLTHNTGKASLAYRNRHQFTDLSLFNLSITNKPKISSLICTQKSHTLNSSRAKLVNNKKSLFAQTQSEIQLSPSASNNLIKNSTISTKMSQPVSAMKDKSTSIRSSRTSPRVSFTDNTTPNTPRQSSSHSNISTPLTDSPQILSFDKVVGKVYNKGLIASLTSKDAVLKEVRDCIIRSDEERLKALNPYLHSYWRVLHVSSGCVCMEEKVAIPSALKDALIEDLHASHPGSWGMICMAQPCWWPYMNRDLLVRATECKPCTAIGKNL